MLYFSRLEDNPLTDGKNTNFQYNRDIFISDVYAVVGNDIIIIFMRRNKNFWLMLSVIVVASLLVYFALSFLLDDTECKELEDVIQGRTSATLEEVGKSEARYSSICE